MHAVSSRAKAFFSRLEVQQPSSHEVADIELGTEVYSRLEVQQPLSPEIADVELGKEVRPRLSHDLPDIELGSEDAEELVVEGRHEVPEWCQVLAVLPFVESAIAAPLFCIYYLVTAGIAHSEKHQRYYLTSGGVGCAVGIFFSLTVLVYVIVLIRAVQRGEAIDRVITVQSDRGLDTRNIKAVFEDGSGLATTGPMLKALVFAGRLLLNMSFIIYNFVTLPPRDPLERLNLAKHVVSWVETSFAAFLFFGALVGYITGNWYAGLDKLQDLAKFSTLRAISRISLSNMQKVWEFMQGCGGVGGILLLLYSCFMTTVAVLALMVKVAQVDFITEELFWGWTWLEYLQLAAFANTIVGIHDTQKEQESALAMHLGAAGSSITSPLSLWKQTLADRLRHLYGLANAAILILSLSTSQISTLLGDGIAELTQDNIAGLRYGNVLTPEALQKFGRFRLRLLDLSATSIKISGVSGEAAPRLNRVFVRTPVECEGFPVFHSRGVGFGPSGEHVYFKKLKEACMWGVSAAGGAGDGALFLRVEVRNQDVAGLSPLKWTDDLDVNVEIGGKWIESPTVRLQVVRPVDAGESSQVLAELLEALPLTTLKLSGCRLSESAAESICTTLEKPSARLRKVALPVTGLGQQLIQRLGEHSQVELLEQDLVSPNRDDHTEAGPKSRRPHRSRI